MTVTGTGPLKTPPSPATTACAMAASGWLQPATSWLAPHSSEPLDSRGFAFVIKTYILRSSLSPRPKQPQVGRKEKYLYVHPIHPIHPSSPTTFHVVFVCLPVLASFNSHVRQLFSEQQQWCVLQRERNSKTVERSFQCDRSNFCLQELRDNKAEGYVLQKFFDEWPKSQQEANGTVNYTSHPASSTHLSISIPGNLSSDFSLKLSTGNDAKKPRHASNNGGANGQLVCSGNNWSGWGHHGEASMGGPLAEVLRSSASTHSPTSVLHKPNGSVSETSSISP
ncbi:hypothetical protein B296_00053462 [Ensete ventricosum]|uniref:Uncharacterized protein n=1 Tax=Ensete ventricosum TaxID=4639 RepID=A0A426XY35_ENSVE|nr:hypothetical protein B296_00053462 [Ensete ventricosum]